VPQKKDLLQRDDSFPKSDTGNKLTQCFMAVHETVAKYTLTSGRFPIPSAVACTTFFVYDYDSNAILMEPVESPSSHTTRRHGKAQPASKVVVAHSHICLDNECSKDMQQFFDETIKIN
jgi:hypothetical protein